MKRIGKTAKNLFSSAFGSTLNYKGVLGGSDGKQFVRSATYKSGFDSEDEKNFSAEGDRFHKFLETTSGARQNTNNVPYDYGQPPLLRGQSSAKIPLFLTERTESPFLKISYTNRPTVSAEEEVIIYDDGDGIIILLSLIRCPMNTGMEVMGDKSGDENNRFSEESGGGYHIDECCWSDD